MNKRTVGILTVWQWICRQDNYGSLLQVYALQQVLRMMGYNPIVLRCASDKEEAFRKQLKHPLYYLFKFLVAAKKKRRRPIERYLLTRHPRHFMDFANAQLALSTLNFSLDDFETVDLRFLDAIVVGSDQVWLDQRPAYFCASTLLPSLRIGYAISNNWSIANTFDESFKTLNHHLTALALREKEGVAICHALGRPDTEWVLDPTLLLSGMTWNTLSDTTHVPHGGIAAYMVKDFPKKLQKELDLYADAHNTKCWKIGVQGAEGDLLKAKNTLWLSPQQWLAWMASSELVVTNSFHGLCFAILFHRPFVALCPPSKSPLRHLNILSRLGLENRLIQSLDELDAIRNIPINWEDVDQRLEEARTASKAFLSNALIPIN